MTGRLRITLQLGRAVRVWIFPFRVWTSLSLRAKRSACSCFSSLRRLCSISKVSIWRKNPQVNLKGSQCVWSFTMWFHNEILCVTHLVHWHTDVGTATQPNSSDLPGCRESVEWLVSSCWLQWPPRFDCVRTSAGRRSSVSSAPPDCWNEIGSQPPGRSDMWLKFVALSCLVKCFFCDRNDGAGRETRAWWKHAWVYSTNCVSKWPLYVTALCFLFAMSISIWMLIVRTMSVFVNVHFPQRHTGQRAAELM